MVTHVPPPRRMMDVGNPYLLIKLLPFRASTSREGS